MITTIKPWLKGVFNTIGIPVVYTETEDESKIKGQRYAWIYEADAERVEKDQKTIAIKAAEYYVRDYELRSRIGVRVAARDELEAITLKTSLMSVLAATDNPVDKQGFDIEPEILTIEYVADKSVLKTGAGYDVTLEAKGGIFRACSADVIDPWLIPLASWTAQKLGDPWKSCAAQPMGTPDSVVYWRVSAQEVEEKGRAHFMVRKKLAARIYSRSGQTTWAAAKIVQELENDFKIPISAALKKYMTVERPEVSFADEFQVSVTMANNTTRPAEEFPLMGRFYPAGKLTEV